MRELFRCPRVVTENVLRRRDAGSLGQVIDERAHELRLRSPFLDELREFFVLSLRFRLRECDCRNKSRQQNERRTESHGASRVEFLTLPRGRSYSLRRATIGSTRAA